MLFLPASILLVSAIAPVAAGTINVAWDPVSGASGYRVYYGTSPGNYTDVVDVGNNTQAALSGIGDCADHYVSAKAYNGNGESAQFATEVAGWAKPQIATGGTIAVTQGDQFTLDIDGANFQSGAQLLIDTASIPTDQNGTPLVRVANPAILSCNRAQALITIDPLGAGSRAMQLGTFAFDVEVVNPDGISGARSASLVVAYETFRSDLNRSDSMTKDRVDGKDLAWLAYAHGSAEGQARWDPDADLNGDGQVDGQDLALLAVNFGQCWTGSGWSGTACP
jgi:hypothetical protein